MMLLFKIILSTLIQIILIVIPILISVAFYTLIERKIIAAVQRRRGPNVVGLVGLLQPFADGLKLLLKELILPSSSNIFIFTIGPIMTFTLSLIAWAVFPFDFGYVLSDLNIGVLYFFATSSLEVYGVIMSGWSSNSKYAFLGAIRCAAQMISYEVSIGLIIINILICAGSLNLTDIVEAQQTVYYFIPLFPMFILFFVSGLAETNRHPFDLAEAEAELVSGYNVEYSAMGFALFFLAEYANMILMSLMTTIFFFGGWLPLLTIFPFNYLPNSFWLVFKSLIFILLFILVRAILPRYRYDQLMQLGWKVFLPLSLCWIFVTSGILFAFDALPL